MKKSNISIFIVEDDTFYLEIIRNTLINEGYSKISVFHNGIDYLNYSGTPPDLIILDHMLGQTSGLHLLRVIAQEHPATQVIFLSAQEDMDVVVKALKLGAFDYIEKTDKHAMTRLTVMMEKAIKAQSVTNRKKRIKSLKEWFLIS